MRLIVNKAQALEIARSHAALYGVPWVSVARVRTLRAWWLLTVEAYQFDIDTGGQGSALATVCLPLQGVQQFEYRPHNPAHFWLPPWAAYPFYTSVTMGWRQGGGEIYLNDWFKWFLALPDIRKAAYQERFPPPDRDGWAGFYDWGKQGV